jgi:hypothetical protein
MKTILGILTVVLVCIFFPTKPTAEEMEKNASDREIIDTALVSWENAGNSISCIQADAN